MLLGAPLPDLLPLAHALHDLGMLLYAGPFVAFTVLVSLSGKLPKLARHDVVRVYRAWGAGLGLSMGAWVLGLLSTHFLTHGAFAWPVDTAAQQLTAARFVVFLVLWAFNIRLEIWTLEPLRKLDGDGEIPAAPFAAATRRLGGEMAIQSGLLLAYVVLHAAAP